MVGQHGARAEVILIAHHEPAGQHADGSLEHAHVDVHRKHGYILAFDERRRKGDDRWIVAAQKFLHIRDLRTSPRVCRGE